MNKIHLLDNNLIDKIAAGEVVERPASVVKELMENSIDAGATAITVEIGEGGISLIRITDNGRGIPREEIPTAFMRHATSKLNAFEDLDNMLTLGFRGEALSSIASVAEVEMITKTSADPEGSKICLKAGNIISQSPAAAQTGTIITVKNLFYNTPARRKFLKRPSAESGYVSEAVNRIALGHPHIAVKYINNGNTMLQTSGSGDLKTAVFHIYGREQASKMTEAALSRQGYSLKGLIGKPELSRANRSYESFFINGRYVKSSLISLAAEEAYKTRLMTGRFPVFVLNLTVPESTVDVNVHPTKLEVRFSDEDFIYQLILDGIKNALKDKELIPEADWSDKREKKQKEPKLKPSQGSIDFDGDKDFVYNAPPKKGEMLRLAEDYNADSSLNDSFAHIVDKLYRDRDEQLQENMAAAPKAKEDVSPCSDINADKSPKAGLGSSSSSNLSSSLDLDLKNDAAVSSKPQPKPFFTHYKIVGQVFNTYWIVEQDDKMYMIDQHAAHERVLYERLIARVSQGENASQLLLQPIAVNLNEGEMDVLEQNRGLLESFGYQIEPLGPKSCALRAVPFVFDAPSGAGFFLDIIDALRDKGLKSIYETKLDALATMSCKAAVKGGNRLSLSEAKALIEQMLRLENPFSCPHGRPTIIEMSKYEVEKKFKRIV